MTVTNYPTDRLGNPDGRDYHYRFRAGNDEAWKHLQTAQLAGRRIEKGPSDMEHLAIKIDHVTLKTHDSMGYIRGMKQYATSPDWQKVPYSQGKMEMKHANGGGSKIRSERRLGERYGKVTLTYTVEATPGEILNAFENGENEDEISEQIRRQEMYAEEDKVEEIKQRRAEIREACEHSHVIRSEKAHRPSFCEDCGMEWRDDRELDALLVNDEATVVGTPA